MQTQWLRDQKRFEHYENANRLGYQYLSEIGDRHVFPLKTSLEELSVFDEDMPIHGEGIEHIIELLHTKAAPATIAQLGGRYFGFVNGAVLPAAMAARIISSYWDANSGLEMTSPLCARLEVIVERWLQDLFDLPANYVSGFVSGTSSANQCAMLAARYRLLKKKGWDINKKGLFGAPPIRIVAGREIHASMIKAVQIAGLGTDHIEWIETDHQGRIVADKLPPLDSNTIVLLQAGNVHSGAFDDFEKIGKKVVAADAWLHIDGAFGLWARGASDYQHLTNGLQYAHSLCCDAHKTLNTPYDSGIILCSDSDALTAALHSEGSYIIHGSYRDGMYYTPEMSRRSRIVELWATLKYLGKNGVNDLVKHLNQSARHIAERLSESPHITVMNEVVFNQLVIRSYDDLTTSRICHAIQKENVCWAGESTWQDKKVIRISICSWATTQEDIEIAVKSILHAADTCTN